MEFPCPACGDSIPLTVTLGRSTVSEGRLVFPVTLSAETEALIADHIRTHLGDTKGGADD